MNGYAGRVAFNETGDLVAVTSPRGGVVLVFDLGGELVFDSRIPDVCGLAAMGNGFLISNGLGMVVKLEHDAMSPLAKRDVAWDNHIVAI